MVLFCYLFPSASPQFKITDTDKLFSRLPGKIIILIFVADYNPARKIPSSKAFLFSLKPYDTNYGPTKIDVSPAQRGQAIRGEKNKGPCWGYDTQEMGFRHQTVKINSNGVFDYRAISNPNSFFTGQSEFQADDLEVFTISGKNKSS